MCGYGGQRGVPRKNPGAPNRRDKTVGRTHKRTRSIQATFWALYPENIVSVEFLERKGDIVKPVKYNEV